MPEFNYKDKVTITGGFYKGQNGEVVGEYRDIGRDDERVFCRAYGHKIKFTDGTEGYVNQFHMEKI